jgi:hypothetical protein
MAKQNEVVAVFPIAADQLVVVHKEPVGKESIEPDQYRLQSGAAIRNAEVDSKLPTRVRLSIAGTESESVVVDSLQLKGAAAGIDFIHGPLTPMDLKVPYVDPTFPYASTLLGRHVTVMCCTGCNGGIHGRNLVVLNNHSGGPWSSIWVKTPKQIDVPYPRWQRVMFAGGILTELNGSTTVVDPGWMIIQKSDETAHHAPPPLPLETADLPAKGTRSLLAKSLDATWVQFDNIVLHRVQRAADHELGTDDLPKTEIEFGDKSGGRSIAWLYQSGREGLTEGQRLKWLRGFVHAEAPGRYILLSDKEEDLRA